MSICTRMGLVTAVVGTNPRYATITLDGTTGVEMRAMEHVHLSVGKSVWVLDSGSGDMLIFGNVDNSPGTHVFPGVVWDWVGTTAPPGWALLDGSTITNAQTLYPDLWAAAPTAWRSGSNLILPNGKGRSVVMYDSGNAFVNTIGALVGAADAATVAHTHAHSLGTGVESQGHVHYIGGVHGNVGGWVSTVVTDAQGGHSHGYGGLGLMYNSPTYGGAVYTPTGYLYVGGAFPTDGSHGHNMSGYSTGAHQQHTHGITGTVDAATGTVSATNRNYHPSLVLNKIIKL